MLKDLRRHIMMQQGVRFIEGISLSDGAFLKTNILPNGNMKAEIEMSTTTSALGILWGARHGWDDRTFGALFNVPAINNKSRFDYAYSSVPPSGVGQTIRDTNKHIFILDKGNCYQDGVNVYTFTTTQFTCSFHLYIGATNNAGSLLIEHGFNIYRFRVWDNGNLIADFKPAIIGGEAGLYEIMGKEFYKNQGVGYITPII